MYTQSTYFLGAFFNRGNYKNLRLTPEQKHQIEAEAERHHQTEAETTEPFFRFVFGP